MAKGQEESDDPVVPEDRREAGPRPLRFGEATRVLFLVDRVSLGDQAETEFLSFVSPDDGRRFGDLYGVQVLRSNQVATAG